MRGCGPAMGVLSCGSATRDSYNLPGKDLVRIGDSIEIGPVYIRPQLRIAVVLLGVGTQCVAYPHPLRRNQIRGRFEIPGTKRVQLILYLVEGDRKSTRLNSSH